MNRISIKLTNKEVEFLKEKKDKERLSKRVRNRIDILLLSHQGKKLKEIAEFLQISPDTVWRTKKKYIKGGLEYALLEKPRPGQPKKYDIRQETEIIAIACSNPPQGRERWTLELLTEKIRKTIKGCQTINRETIRLMLKKTNLSLG
jgi:transposase